MKNVIELFDSEGFLLNLSCWSTSIALKIAQTENIILTIYHWNIINYLRTLYYKKNINIDDMKSMVFLVKRKYGNKIGNSITMYKLFPKSPVFQSNKIAGLKRPKKCF